jgi:hypothetical protein
MRAEARASLHVKCLLFSPDFNQNWNILTHYSNSPVSAVLELLHMGRHDEANWRTAKLVLLKLLNNNQGI